MTAELFVVIVLAIVVIVMLVKTAVVVPQQSAFVVERVGKYRTTLDAGFHILMPFLIGCATNTRSRSKPSTFRSSNVSPATTFKSPSMACYFSR